MPYDRPTLVLCAALVVAAACGADGAPALSATIQADAGAGVAVTSLRAITYNVAGLPEGLSASMPALNSPLISPLLNDYDLAFLQEDFSYQAEIASMVRHAYRSPADARDASLGDGLTSFSSWPMRAFERVKWSACHGQLDSGSDCLTPKGFTVARMELAPDARVDVYDLHADAGDGPDDVAARASNLAQLTEAILTRSAGRALIVAGDFNTRFTRDDAMAKLLAATGLRDPWVELVRGGAQPAVGAPVSCSTAPDDPACERIDKILYRGGDGLTLTPVAYAVQGQRFRSAQGVPLSDHVPVSVRFEVVGASGP